MMKTFITMSALSLPGVANAVRINAAKAEPRGINFKKYAPNDVDAALKAELNKYCASHLTDVFHCDPETWKRDKGSFYPIEYILIASFNDAKKKKSPF